MSLYIGMNQCFHWSHSWGRIHPLCNSYEISDLDKLCCLVSKAELLFETFLQLCLIYLDLAMQASLFAITYSVNLK